MIDPEVDAVLDAEERAEAVLLEKARRVALCVGCQTARFDADNQPAEIGKCCCGEVSFTVVDLEPWRRMRPTFTTIDFDQLVARLGRSRGRILDSLDVVTLDSDVRESTRVIDADKLGERLEEHFGESYPDGCTWKEIAAGAIECMTLREKPKRPSPFAEALAELVRTQAQDYALVRRLERESLL